MKKALVLLIVLCLTGAIWASSFGFGADLAFAQDFIINRNAVQANIDFRTAFGGQYELRVPITVDFADSNIFIEGGITFVYYPWDKGFYMGLSALQMGYSLKQRISGKALFNLNEVVVGWTLNLPWGFLVEPELVVRNPSGTYDDEYSELLGALGNYGRFRGRLLFGWKYNE